MINRRILRRSCSCTLDVLGTTLAALVLPGSTVATADRRTGHRAAIHDLGDAVTARPSQLCTVCVVALSGTAARVVGAVVRALRKRASWGTDNRGAVSQDVRPRPNTEPTAPDPSARAMVASREWHDVSLNGLTVSARAEHHEPPRTMSAQDVVVGVAAKWRAFLMMGLGSLFRPGTTLNLLQRLG